jgi:hypothetical protein
MSDPSYDLQVALVAALRAALASVVGDRIYDRVPPAAAFPYVSLGPNQVLPDKAGCIDGVEVSVQIDAWSREVDFGEVKTIGKAIIAALDDQPLAVDGFNVTVFELAGAQYLRDPDGLTRHAAITFRGLLEAST